jgi:putative nucleotidyltransferase with HDIG domain
MNLVEQNNCETMTDYGKILVVDDDTNVREIVSTFLKYYDFTVDTAGDGVEALQMVKKDSYDLILSDIQMPRMDGLTLAGEVQKYLPDTIVILMTGYASINTAVEAIKRDVFDYVLKPFQNMQSIRQTIHRALERKRLIEENKTLIADLRRANIELAYHRKLLSEKVEQIDSELNRRIERATTLYEVSRSISSMTKLDHLLTTVMAKVISAMKKAIGILWLVDTNEKTLKRVVTIGFADVSLIPETLEITDSEIGSLVRSGQTKMYHSSAELTDPLLKTISSNEGTNTCLLIPLRFENEILGAMTVFFRFSYDMSDDDVSLLIAIADQTSVSIKNAELFTNQQKMFRETIEALATAIDSRDHYTGGHSFMVTQYALAIAARMGFDEKRLELIRVAGLLHDVGKIGVSDAVLNKPGKLTDEETSIIRAHPVLGRVILESIDALKPTAKIVYHHHERYDGKGYPEGLAGNDIPIESRILQIADIFHALNSDRIYRKALPLDKSIDIIREGLGTVSDPEIGNIFLDLVNEGMLEKFLVTSEA